MLMKTHLFIIITNEQKAIKYKGAPLHMFHSDYIRYVANCSL